MYATELKVVSEDGTVLQTLKYPAAVEVYRDEIDLFVVGSNKYLRIGVSVDENGNEYMNLYKIIKDAQDPSKVSIATAPMRVSVSPRMASRNQDINIVAEGNGVREVIVTNAAGQVVYSTKVAARMETIRDRALQKIAEAFARRSAHKQERSASAPARRQPCRKSNLER